METERHGFSLMEIFIVMVVLAIIASIAVPKLSQAASQAQCTYLCDALQDVRSGIALYSADHDDRYPGSGSATWVQAMTGQTNSQGDVYTSEMAQAGEEAFGPYLDCVPKNPYSDLNTVEVTNIDLQIATTTTGWYFNCETGLFRANDLDAHINY